MANPLTNTYLARQSAPGFFRHDKALIRKENGYVEEASGPKMMQGPVNAAKPKVADGKLLGKHK
jgi:hypothetical protein